MPTFTPPTVQEGSPGVRDPLVARLHLDRGVSVVKVNGHYVTQRFPWAGDLEGLTPGVDYFIGGYTYTISSAVASALNADGFTTGP